LILQEVGIGINDVENGVFLCMKKSACTGTIHSGRHSAEYYKTVNEILEKAYDSGTDIASKRSAVEKALEEIANKLREGKLSL
jgi:hypothetical protein